MLERAAFFRRVLRRPVAIGTLFTAVCLLGLYSWLRIPIELLPAIQGDQLFISFYRPNGDPELVEREIVQPLEARVATLQGVIGTRAQIVSSGGSFTVDFDLASRGRLRELELQTIAADIARDAPPGTSVRVQTQDFTRLSRYVMSVQVLGGDDVNVLRHFVERQLQPKLEAIPGLSQVIVYGGGARELTVAVDAAKCAEFGIVPADVSNALRRNLRNLTAVGEQDDGSRRLRVVLDGRPRGTESLGAIRIFPDRPVLVRHVADVSIGPSPQSTVARVNGERAVTITFFQDKGANLVELGGRIRARVAELRESTLPYGIDLLISSDAADVIEERLARLKTLALSGFAIGLLVLFVFLRRVQGVAVVAIAVPVSLLATGALLYLTGFTINIVTLFGLVIGVGMLIDNSTVVFEATQRNLEKGVDPESAAVGGVSSTLRAIVAASATNAVVFAPLFMARDLDPAIRTVLQNLVPAILYPMTASLLVAVFLVPLLALKFAPPTNDAKTRQQAATGGFLSVVFPAVLKAALRQPAVWLGGLTAAVAVTVVVGVPWVAVTSLGQSSASADEARFEVTLDGERSLADVGDLFTLFERKVRERDGIARVESNYRERRGSLSVYLEPREQRPADVSVSTVAASLSQLAQTLDGVSVRLEQGAAGTASQLESAVREIAVSGTHMAAIAESAHTLRAGLAEVPGIEDVWLDDESSTAELAIVPDQLRLQAFGMSPLDAVRPLSFVGREGERLPINFTFENGYQIPIVIRRVLDDGARLKHRVERLQTIRDDQNIALAELVDASRTQAPVSISHVNGIREARVKYTLSAGAPETGPARMALEERIDQAIADAQPGGDVLLRRVNDDRAGNYVRLILIPIALLVYAVLAMTFESLTLPLLVLVALPLTAVGAVWALVVSGSGMQVMTLVGIAVLLGLAVNPAIILIDRMQQKVRLTGCSPGSAAMTAVRERVRPVTMISLTTIAALWPMAISGGRGADIWPAFAVVVIGGLIAACVLTLVAIPIGYVMVARATDRTSRLDIVALALVVTLIALVVSWAATRGYAPQLSTQFALATLLLLVYAVLRFMLLRRARDRGIDHGVAQIYSRSLNKTYGKRLSDAWAQPQPFAQRVVAMNSAQLAQLALMSLVLGAAAWLSFAFVQTAIWRACFAWVAWLATCVGAGAVLRGSELAGARRTGQWLVRSAPWLALILSALLLYVLPRVVGEAPTLGFAPLGFLTAGVSAVILGRATAVQLANSMPNPAASWWRRSYEALCQKWLSMGLPPRTFEAVGNVSFDARAGLVGVLGPNGAGKTTCLRMLAGIIEPTGGVVRFAKRASTDSVPPNQVGYLPQEFGLPAHLTGREYLEYFALSYRLGDRALRCERVDALIDSVGLREKQNDRIGAYSGGMQQRLAIARALLCDPPVIIVDEPTVGLDPRERIRLRNLLTRLAKERVVLFSTHIVEDVAVACDRVLVLKQGQLVFDGTPAALAARVAGSVWEYGVASGGAPASGDDRPCIVNRVMQAGGETLRVVAQDAPSKLAVRVDATLEDGYIDLLHAAGSACVPATPQVAVPAAPAQRASTVRDRRPATRSWRDAVAQLAVSAKWDFGALTPWLALVPLVWPLMYFALMLVGWLDQDIDAGKLQNRIVGVPVYVLAGVLGARLVANEIGRRTLEVTYLLPGGAAATVLRKWFGAVVLLGASIVLLSALGAVLFDALYAGVTLRIALGAVFYLTVATALGAALRSETGATVLTLILLLGNLRVTDNAWLPLFNPSTLSQKTALDVVASSIHNASVVVLMTLFVLAYVVALVQKPEKLLRD